MTQWLRLLRPTLLVCASLGLLCVALPACLAAPPAPATPSPQFEMDVLPIFRAHCARCHGVKPRKAGLNLSSREGVFEGSESGPVIEPGKVGESVLFKMVHE